MVDVAEPGLRIHLFGQPRFFFDGQPYAFHGRPRALPLLTFLLLHQGAHLTRDSVAFTLWPDDSETEARGKLRRYLHHVTSALPAADAPYIVSKDDTIAWNDGVKIWLDVGEFERYARQQATWSDAVDLYVGDLALPVYDEWINPIRERLRREYLAMLEQLLLLARSRRDFSSALSYGERILIADQWREDTLRQVAAIRYESGDRAGALREIDRFSERLASEMKVESMPETIALRALMARGGALPDAPSQQSFDVGPSGSALPFVGRTTELNQLIDAWRRAAQGHGNVVMVAGAAGMGKTRLANELALTANAQGARVLRGTTSSPELIPYQAIVEALRDALPLIAKAQIRPIWLAALSPLIPEIALTSEDLPRLPTLDAERERSRLLEALAAVIHGLARERPLLVVFEDLQWAGEATSASLEYLARRLRSTPALLLATYRDEEDAITRTVQPLRRKLQLENVAHHISLGGLSIEAVCDLARNVPVLAPSADAVGLRAHAVSGGNPLFAAELLRESAESGIHDVSSRFLQAIIESRTARISETARKVAHAASVIGATFDSEVLRDVTALPEHAVSEGIAELVARNFVRQIGSVNFAFAFAHELIASTIYERIDASNRIEWHRRVAEAIERISTSGDDAAGQVAYHYEKGAAPEEAARFYLTAAQRSFDVFANADALAMATRGLELTRNPERRQQLLGLRERILGRLGERDAQAADIEALEELANDDDSRLDVLWRRAQLAHARGELVDEARYLRSLEGPSTHSAVHALARRAWSRNLMLRSEYVEAAHIAEKALENARNAGDVAAEVDSLCLLAELAVNQGEASRAQDFLAQAELHAARASDLVLMARVAMASAAVAIMRREFARALTHAQEAQRRYRDIGDRDGEAEATARVGAALSFLMRFDDAAQEFSTAAAIYRALGNRLQLAYLAFNETGTQMQRGLLSEARASLLNALDIFKDLGDARGRAVCLTNLSMVRLLQQAATEAKALGVDALHAARQIANAAIEAAALSNLGNAERELGELDAALGHMHEAIAIRKRLGRSATFEELADLALAQLKAGQGAARETADDIMARAEKSGENTVWPHYCYWAAACVYHENGDEDRALEALRRAEHHIRRQLRAMSDQRSRSAFQNLVSVRAISVARRGIWS